MRQIRSLLLVVILLLLVTCIASGPSRTTLGIASQDEGYYGSKVIKCKDGSKKFTRDQLNDDFCDCPDGTDEPGTSACPEGKFYCRNTGHTPISIFSSRVNDGICDCCDGSDEYDGKANCSNTCWEAGKVARERLKKKIVMYQEGVKIRRQEVEKAKYAFAKNEAELSKLKNEEIVLKGLVHNLKEKKEQIEKAEEQERLIREKEALILKESEKNASEHIIQSEGTSNVDEKKVKAENLGSSTNDEIKLGDDSTIEDAGDVHVEHLSTDYHEVNQHAEEEKTNDAIKHETTIDAQTEHDSSMLASEPASDKNTIYPGMSKEDQAKIDSEELSKEELGRLVASRWTGETVDNKPDDTDVVKKQEEQKDDLEHPENAEGEDFGGYNTETDDDKNKYGDEDDDDYQDNNDHNEDATDTYHPDSNYDPESDDSTESPDYTFSSSTSWLSKIQQTVQNILLKVNIFKSPVNTTEAAHVRREYDHASSKLSKIQSRITSLTDKLKHDFGKEREYYSFYDQCFEIKQNKYVYKVCPYKQASQIEGHSTTRLGEWGKFEENFRVMHFSNGDRCWNGPDRSLKVRLRCGLKDELTDFDEPSRCEYTAFLSTPLVCTQEKLKELESKQELLSAGQSPLHDEF